MLTRIVDSTMCRVANGLNWKWLIEKIRLLQSKSKMQISGGLKLI